MAQQAKNSLPYNSDILRWSFQFHGVIFRSPHLYLHIVYAHLFLYARAHVHTYTHKQSFQGLVLSPIPQFIFTSLNELCFILCKGRHVNPWEYIDFFIHNRNSKWFKLCNCILILSPNQCEFENFSYSLVSNYNLYFKNKEQM